MKYANASQRQGRTMLILYAAFLLIWSVSILMMPIASVQKEVSKIPIFLSGACFWSGLAGTLGMMLKINNERKKDGAAGVKHSQGKLGLISFFQNKEATFADIIMLASIVGFLIVRLCTDNVYWLFVFFALFVFFFGMHCMLNGRNYVYLNYKIKGGEKS